MRTLICFLIICSLAVTQGLSQVKIGDNPQNIDASSILELESSSRVFVITRVNSSEMNTITPLRGALVYNTDEQCVFYYDGGQWSNLCAEENTTNVSFELVDDELVLTDSDGNTVSVPLEGVGEQSFTAEPIVNFRETIIITQTGNTFNFEVGQITGENIADSTIQGVDFAPESITQDKIAPASIGTSELQDNAVTDDDIDFFSADAVTLNDFTNDAGFITAAQLISPDANNAITDSNGAFYNDVPLLNDIANNNQRITDHLSLDNDLDDQNERLTNAILDGNELVLTEGGIDTRINLGSLNNAGTDNQNLSLNVNRIEIDNATGVDLTALLAANNISVNPVGNITSTDVQEALEELQVDINNLNAGGGNTDEQTLATDNTPGNISITNGGAAITLNVNDGDFDPNNEIQNALEVDINPITGITGNNVQLALEELQTDVDNLVSGGGADGVVSNVTFDGTDLNFTGANGGFDGAVDISALAGGGADGVVSNVGLTGNELVFTGAAGGFNGNIDLTPILGGANTDEQDLSLAGNTLNITNGAGVDLTPILGATNTDEQELTLLGDDLSIDNGNTVDLSTIDNQTASEVIFTPYVTLPGPSTQLAIQQLKDELDTATIAGGGENPTNELQDIELTGTIVNLTIPATPGNQIDLDPTFVTEAELAVFPINDGDFDPLNEIELPDDAAATAGQILATNVDGTYSWVDDQTGAATIVSTDADQIITVGTDTGALLTNVILDATFATDAELTAAVLASDALDLDIDPNNEIELPDDAAATAGQVLATNVDGTYSWVDDQTGAATIVSTDADQIITVGTDTGALLTNAILDATFATDAELTAAVLASDALDLDIDPNNEIELPDDAAATAGQILATNVDGTYSWVDDQTGAATIVSTDADQIITVGTDTGALLTNAILDATFATDAELTAAVLASDALDLDIDPNNEIELPDDAAATAGQILATNVDGTYSWVDDQTGATTIVSNDADQIITVGTDTGALLTNAILDATFATDAELAALGNTNFAADDLSLSNNRTHDLGGFDLVFGGLGSIGIGNGANPPQNKFHVAGEIRVEGVNSADGTENNPAYTFSGDTNNDTGMYRPAADEIGFSAGGQEALRIEEDGGNTNVIVNQSLELDGTLTDINGLNGTAGQILSSTGAAVEWIDAPIGGAVNVAPRLTGDGQVATPLDIADDAITTIKINDAAVTTAKIANGEVQTANIADNNVTPAKIQEGADGQVLITNGTDVQWGAAPAGASLTGTTIDGDGTTGNVLELADDAVTTAKILDGTIESADMGENSVTSFSINNNTIFNLDINTNAAIQGTKINPNFGGQDIATTGNLTVGGTVTVQGVPVHPDYVFQKYFTGFSNLKNDYYLLTLQEVESFIKKHHHLPGIKSAKEFEEQGGFDLGKASKINLEKIEELFLHTIEQEKKIETLHSENKELSEELNSLKSEIELIKSMLIQKQND